jgi:hypothetical protein
MPNSFFEVLIGATSLSNKENLTTFRLDISRVAKHEQYVHDDFDIAVVILAAKALVISMSLQQ